MTVPFSMDIDGHHEYREYIITVPPTKTFTVQKISLHSVGEEQWYLRFDLGRDHELVYEEGRVWETKDDLPDTFDDAEFDAYLEHVLGALNNQMTN